jgi:glycosyltransferase involved in cell wall biosynthesis
MKERYRIAMVAACPFPYPRGTPIRIFRLAEALARRGHEIHVVTYHLGETATTPFKIHRIPDVGTYRKLSPGPSYQKLLVLDLLLLFKLRSVLRSCEIDVVHAHHYEGLLVSLLAQRRVKYPVIFDCHTLLASELPFYPLGLFKGAKKWIGGSLDSILPGRASHVVAVTEEIKAQLVRAKVVSEDKIVVISNGIEPHRFAVPEGARPLAPGKKAIVFTGNLAPYQGVELLLSAFREILRVRNDVRLFIVSDSVPRRYAALAESLQIKDHIELKTAKFDAVPRFLAGADVVVNPRTECDGIPQKLLNYMAAGKAIVSFAGSAKNLRHEEEGLVVEDGDAGAFANAILRLVDDPMLAHRLGNNAKTYARSELSWDKAARQLEAVYERVTGKDL